MLEMPQTTVSYKIRDALRRLRGSLAQAGVAAVAPLLNAGSLHEAACSGVTPPAGLMEQVMARLGDASAFERASVRHGASWRGRLGVRLLGGAVLATALAVGAGWWALRGSFESTPSRKADGTPEPFHVRWTFDDGPRDDFEVFHGNWEGWRPRKGDRPACVIAPPKVEDYLSCRLPAEFPKKPLLATAWVCWPWAHERPRFASCGLTLHWWASDPEEGQPHTRWGRVLSRLPPGGGRARVDKQRFRYRIYFIGAYVFGFHEPAHDRPDQGGILLPPDNNFVLIEIFRFRAPYPSRRLGVNLHGLGLEKLEIRELSEDEIPSMLRGPKGLVERIRGDDSWQCTKGR
jgi:hypothetical protein